MNLQVDKNIRLELTAEKHAEGLFQAVDNSREHLSTFLSWVGNMQSTADFTNYIENCESLYLQKKEVSFVILFDNLVVGRIGLHHWDLQNQHAAIGYWLTKNAEGKGIITKSCEKLIQYGFQELNLHRIEIKAAVENVKSQAIPERFHFKKEGILRGNEYVNGKFLDLFIYSILESEWKERIGENR